MQFSICSWLSEARGPFPPVRGKAGMGAEAASADSPTLHPSPDRLYDVFGILVMPREPAR